MSIDIPNWLFYADCIVVLKLKYPLFKKKKLIGCIKCASATVLIPLLICGHDSKGDAEWKSRSRVCILMSLAYSSNIGGTGSLIGSGPQLALKGILNE